MQNNSQFELHSFATMTSKQSPSHPLDFSDLPWQDDQHPKPHVMALGFAGQQAGPYPVGADAGKCELRRAAPGSSVLAEFYLVNRPLGPALAMVPRCGSVLVNGLSALSFQVLSPRDGLLLSPGLHTYVTQRIKPYIGQPRGAMLKQSCPVCRIPLTQETHVITCRCHVAYHHETGESHPDAAASDRLNCFEQIRVCLSCNRPLTLGESLVWDPATV